MADILQKADELLQLIQKVIDSDTGKNLPAKNKAFLVNALETCENLLTQLKTINDEIILLTNFEDKQNNLSRNVEFWNSLPPGAIREKTKQYEKLKENSSTIADFYQASIDISEIVKFNKNEINLSKDMVRDFKKIYLPWSKFKKAIGRNKNEFEAKAMDAYGVKELLRILKKYQVILDFQTGIFSLKTNSWVELDIEKICRLKNPRTAVRVVFTLDQSYQNFIIGNWFNAYTYTIFSDQLQRLKVDYEIYPLVSYTSQANAKLSKGEIDVLIRIGNKFLFVECKSGWLFNDHNNQIQEIIENREKVREICNSARISDYEFMLVYNSLSNDPKDISKAFQNSQIITIEITDLQGKIIDFVRKLEN